MDAPLSFTITTGMLAGNFSVRMKASVSRDAVPLPIAMASTLNFAIAALIRRPDISSSRSG